MRCHCQMKIEATNAQGQATVIEYRYVSFLRNGPELKALLDLRSIRPREAEAQAALRLWSRIRRVYGVLLCQLNTLPTAAVTGLILGVCRGEAVRDWI